MIPHAALLMFFEVLLKGNAEVRKDKTIKEENKFQIITIFKSSSGFNQDFQRWPVNLCFSSATQQKALIFRKVLKHPEYLIYSCTVLESQATLCIKVKNLRIWISFELYTLLFPVEIFLFVCFRRPWQATEKVGGVELPLFTAVGTSQLPVGLWHGPDCVYVCFLSLGQCPHTKLQRSLAEWWRRVRTGSDRVPVQSSGCQNQEKQAPSTTVSSPCLPAQDSPSLRPRLSIPHVPGSQETCPGPTPCDTATDNVLLSWFKSSQK